MTAPYPDQSLPGPAPTPIPPARAYVLRSERTQWERRAAVAGDAAESLGWARQELADVLRVNAFGKCVEGEAVYEGLKSAVRALGARLTEQEQAALLLARNCEHAGRLFEFADEANAEVLDA